MVEAETGGPLEGAVAVYIYTQMPVYDGGEASRMVTPFLDPWVRVSKWLGVIQIGMHEEISDSNGRITIPSFGPVRRRRNFAFQNSVPEMFIFKRGYSVKRMFNREFEEYDKRELGEHSIVPKWAGKEIKLSRADYSRDRYRDVFEALFWIYNDLDLLFNKRKGYFLKTLPYATDQFYTVVSEINISPNIEDMKTFEDRQFWLNRKNWLEKLEYIRLTFDS
ncbi:MAG TPA: hypothetical protein PK014_03890 [Thermoanaerobaculia bacterium]|nr:hypothetical protein [Thermoanaerobaculia bacterium]HUM29083.1 hypothetical protein [Thermoanaerobaculia bacterium]HXK67460.1 hypothetical protein [Thermoanaerobaculia bacterium]